MINPITEKTLTNIAKQWSGTIENLNESAVYIWPPINGANRRVMQFLGNQLLKKELLGDKAKYCFFVDLGTTVNLSIDDVEKQLAIQMDEKTFSIKDFLNKGRDISIFIFGIDNALNENQLSFFAQTGQLLREFSKLTLLYFSEKNLKLNQNYNSVAAINSAFRNVYYFPLYSREDSFQFMQYISEMWNLKVPLDLKNELYEKIGGHFLLLKDSLRQYRNGFLKIEDILTSESMIEKGMLIFNSLVKKDRITIKNILKYSDLSDVSEYLLKTGIVAGNSLQLKYFNFIIRNITGEESIKLNAKNSTALDYLLTINERDVYDLLSDSKGCVDRENIAKALWKENWEDKYSEWAIDQTIHRLRQKIKKAKLPYKIITKKGRGFILQKK